MDNEQQDTEEFQLHLERIGVNEKSTALIVNGIVVMYFSEEKARMIVHKERLENLGILVTMPPKGWGLDV